MKFKITFIVLIAFVCVSLFAGFMPQSAKAETIAELQQLINNLLAQVAVLQQKIANLSNQGTPWCHTFNTNLRIGDSGSEVAYLQTALEKEGLYQSQGRLYFDGVLASAVIAFQQKYRSEILSPTGLAYGTGNVAWYTRSKLNKLYGCSNQGCFCTQEYNPVCGKDGKTYSNACTANCSGTSVNYYGQCVTSQRIIVSSPSAYQVIKSPVRVSGQSDTFEGNVRIRVKDASGRILADTFTMGGSYGQLSSFSKDVFYSAPSTNTGYVEVFEDSAKDGSEINKVSVFVTFGESTEKSVKVITPNGGETLISGNSGYVTIKWQSTGIEKVDIRLIDYSYSTSISKPIVENLTASNGVYYWPASGVVSILDNNFKAGDNFRILVTERKSDGTFGIQDQSDGFVYINTKICSDSDGGREYYNIGTVNNLGANFTDYCVDSYKLKEYFCLQYSDSGLGGIAEDIYTCLNGCLNGACRN